MHVFSKISCHGYICALALMVTGNVQAMSVSSMAATNVGSAISSVSSLSSMSAPITGQCEDSKKTLQVVVRSRIQPNEFKSSSIKDANDYERGVRYFQGSGVVKDVKAAIAAWTEGAAMGCPRSQYCLADCYQDGCGVSRDEVEALWYYLKSAKQGILPAAKKYHLFGIDMIEHYPEATLKGDLKPLCKLKDCYLAGMDDNKNSDLWCFETKGAVHAWYVERLTNLGSCWLFGDHGTVKNEKLAVECFTCAADEGLKNALLCHDKALVHLGYCRIHGLGLEKDAKEAVALFEEAVTICGSAEGMTQLGICFEEGRGVTKDVAHALNLFKQAELFGDPVASFHIAACYEVGDGVAQNYQKAIEHYLKAARLGHGESCYVLGEIYWRGVAVAQDVDIAIFWLHKAVEYGDGERAQVLLDEIEGIDNGENP